MGMNIINFGLLMKHIWCKYVLALRGRGESWRFL